MKYCKAEVGYCSYCGEKGHEMANCPVEKNKGAAKCINCERANAKANHPAVSKECPSYLRAVERYTQKIKYDDDE